MLLVLAGLQGKTANTGEGQMATDLLHQADHAGIARAIMLRAIRARAAAGDELSLGDIFEALEDLDQVVAEGDWFGLVRRAFWLAARANGGDA